MEMNAQISTLIISAVAYLPGLLLCLKAVIQM